MREWRKNLKRLFVLALSVILIGTSVDLSTLTVAAEELQVQEGVSDSDATDVSDSNADVENSAIVWDEVVTENWVPSAEFPENDDLFAGYVDKVFYGGFSFFGRSAREQLPSDAAKALYDVLKAEILKVAAGTLATTTFDVSDVDEAIFTYTNTTSDAAYDKFYSDYNLVLDALMHDCPYELYWFDKTTGTSYSYWPTTSGTTATFSLISVKFYVAGTYQADNYNTEAPAVNTTVTGATSSAVNAAKAIVTANEGKSDYEKLVAYKEAICELVSYNTAAANSGTFSTNSNPWQLIYVFDGDSSTKVVCEGYSKAFQYLCDCSTFTATNCYTVTGEMVGATGSGGHMWNIVTMEDGNNYLVDVTNSDSGTVGQDGELFLAGGTAASKNFNVSYPNGTSGVVTYNGYNFSAGGTTVFFGYDEETEALWGTDSDSILNLASSDYEPPKPYMPTTLQVGDVVVISGGILQSTTSGTGWSYDASTNTLTLSGGTITGTDYGIYVDGDLDIQVTGDALVASTDGWGIFSTESIANETSTLKITIEDDAELEVMGVTTDSNEGDNYEGILCFGDLEISGGKLEATAYTGILAIGNLNISDTTIYATGFNKGITSEGRFTVAGSIINAIARDEDCSGIGGNPVATDSILMDNNSDMTVAGDVTLKESITLAEDGSLTLEDGATLTIPNGVTLDITKINSASLGTGASVTVQDGGTLLCGHPDMDEDNICSICGGEYVATVQVGSKVTYYETFEAAIEAATDGAYVLLLKDISLSTETPASIEIKKDITIDLDEKTLDLGGYQLDIRPGYEVAIYGYGGKITGNHLNGTIMNVGTLLLEDVEVSNTNTGNSRPVLSQDDLTLDGGVINGSLYPSGTLTLENSPEITGNLQFYLAVDNCDLDIIIGSDLDKTYNMEPLGFGAADNVITCSNGVTLNPDWFENAHASKFVLVHDSENNSMGVRLNIAITTIEQNELTYTGSELTNIFKVISGSDTLVENTDFTVTVNGSQKAINAGEYTATITGIGRWYAGTVTKTFVIDKAVIDSVAVDVTAPVAQATPQSSIPAGSGYTGTISWSPEVTNNKFGFNTAYSVAVVLTADGNHEFTENTVYGTNYDSAVVGIDTNGNSTLTLTKTYTATRKESISSMKEISGCKLSANEYCATAAEVISILPTSIFCDVETGTVSFDIEWSIEGTFNANPDAQNTFKWVVNDADLTNYDYNSSSIPGGSIIMENPSAIAVSHTGTNAEITYDGNTYDVSELFTIDSNAGTATYKVVTSDAADAGDGTLSGTVLTITKAGKITIQLTTAANGRYAAGTATAVLTVNKAAGTGSVSVEDITYGETLTTSINSTTNSSYTVLYTGTGYNSSMAPVNAGDYTLIVTFAANGLYKEVAVSTTFAIKKATPVVSGVSVSDTLYESTLPSEVVLVAETLSTPGTLKLDGVTGLTAGTKEYAYVFTPDDTDNYEVAIGTVQLTVLENALVKIELADVPEKTEYIYGEEFDIFGAKVIATFADNSTKDVTSLVTYDKSLVAGQTEVVLTYQNKKCTVYDINVYKKQLDISNLAWGEISYTYDGQEKSVGLTGEVPAGVTVTLSGNKATNAGAYDAKAEFSLADGYSEDNYELTPNIPSIEVTWHIEPKEINLSNTVYVRGNSLTYNGAEQTQTLQSVKADGLEVTYEIIDNTATNAGSYTMAINANGNFVGSIQIPWSIAKKDISDAEIILGSTLTYNGTAQTQTVNSVTTSGISMTAADYSISGNTATNAGNYTLTVTAAENSNFTGNTTANWSIAKKDISSVEITANNILTYNGEEQTLDYTVGKVDGLSVTYDATGYKASNAGDYELTITANGNFTGTVTKAWSIALKDITDAQIIIGSALTYNGAEQSQSISSVTVDGLTLKATDYDISGNTATDAGNYTLTITGKGNYTGMATKAYSVAKADAPVIADVLKSYTYTVGNNDKTVSIDLATLLPNDFNATAYTLTANNVAYVLEEAVSTAGKLTYKVANTGNIGDTTTLTVTAASKNYEDATIKVVIKITDKYITVLKSGAEVTVTGDKTLTYGQKAGDLAFDTTKAVFVVEGTDTVVEGTLSWIAPDTVYNPGQASPQWKFTPNDTSNYTEVTGTITIQVNKAVPTVASPAAEVFTYHPEKTLADIILVGNNGSHTVAGSSVVVDGSWKFKDETTVPVVNNTGYVVVFTPVDSANYEVVEKTVSVEVTKATPSVDVKPEAATITYGQTLADATLSGGKSAYESGSTISVDGSFVWKDATIVPTVFNSNFTEYVVEFIPADADNYISVTFKMTVTVNKAPKAPNMPSEAMDVAYDVDNVSKASLPNDWSWASEDADTELQVGVAETAVANYTGSDAGNYVIETVTVTITRASAPKQPTIITAPDGVPFIYGNKSQYGWDVINKVFVESKSGETINVDMNGSKLIPAYVQETIKGKELTGTFHMGNGLSWTVSGLSVKSTQDLNMGISCNNSKIPANVANKVINNRFYMNISVEHSGKLGLTAILNVNVKPENKGRYANLFYYNEKYGTLQFVCADEIDELGMAHLPFTHFSEYIVVVDDTIMNNTYTSPKTGDDMSMNYWWFVAFAVFAVSSGYVATNKKRR